MLWLQNIPSLLTQTDQFNMSISLPLSTAYTEEKISRSQKGTVYGNNIVYGQWKKSSNLQQYCLVATWGRQGATFPWAALSHKWNWLKKNRGMKREGDVWRRTQSHILYIPSILSIFHSQASFPSLLSHMCNTICFSNRIGYLWSKLLFSVFLCLSGMSLRLSHLNP